MTDEHPLMRKARANLGLSEPLDGFEAFVDKLNERHYTDANPKPWTHAHQEVELVITTKADIANSQHRASPQAMDKLAWMMEEVGHPAVTKAQSAKATTTIVDAIGTQINAASLARIEDMLERLVKKFL